MQYLCMKPIIDDREKDNVIRSRIGIERKCSWIYPDSDLHEMLKEMFDRTQVVKDWILIDEAQFLSPTQIDQLARIVDDYGVNIVCYGLRTDFQSHLFEGSIGPRTVPFASPNPAISKTESMRDSNPRSTCVA